MSTALSPTAAPRPEPAGRPPTPASVTQRPEPSLRSNFGWTFSSNAFYAACQWGMLSVLAKAGSPTIVGQFALGLAITAPVFMFTNLQLRAVKATDARSDFEFADYFTLRVLASLAGLLFVAAVAWWLPYDPGTRLVVLLVGVSKLVESLSDVVAGLLQKHERLDQVAISLFIRGVLSVTAFAIAFLRTHNLTVALVALVSVWTAVFVFYDIWRAAAVLAPGDGFWRWRRPELRRLLVVSLPLGWVATLLSLNMNVPRYVLQRDLGSAEQGMFASLAYVVVAINLVVLALAQSATTRLSRMFAVGDLAGFRALLAKLSTLGALIAVVGCPIALLVGRPLLTLLYRREYGDHAGLLAILVATAGIGTIGSFVFCGANAARSFRPQVPVYGLATVVCAAGSVLLTPRFGADGAALALLLSALVIVGGGMWVLSSAMRARHDNVPQHDSEAGDAEGPAVITSRRPKVTLVAPHDGRYFLIDRLIDAYGSFGYSVEFVGWDRTNQYPKLVVENSVVYRYLFRGWGYANWRLLIALPIWTLRLALDMMTRRTSLVHAFDFDGAFGVALGLSLRSTPFLYDIQDNFELRHNFPSPLRRLIGKLNAFVVKRSAKTIVVGDERITGSLRKLRDKIAIIPNCPPDVPPPAGLVRDTSTLTLASVGRIAEQRGILMLLEACRKLPWLRVEMAGVVETDAMAQALAACPQVSLHGYMPQAKALELVHKADLCFAFYDPATEICRLANGAKWYDAMMAGKPVFTNTEVVASARMVREGFCYAVPYSDLEGFVHTLTRIHADRKELCQKGARARELYETQFNRRAMDRRLHEVVDDACGVQASRTLAVG